MFGWLFLLPFPAQQLFLLHVASSCVSSNRDENPLVAILITFVVLRNETSIHLCLFYGSMDGSVCLCGVCVYVDGAWCLWLLLAVAGVEDRKRSRGLVLFFLLVLFVSPLTFLRGGQRGRCVPMDSMRARKRGQGKVGEILLGPPTGHMNKPTPYSVTH